MITARFSVISPQKQSKPSQIYLVLELGKAYMVGYA
jgi:hypothetical protein